MARVVWAAITTVTLFCLADASGAEDAPRYLTAFTRPDPASVILPKLPLTFSEKDRRASDSNFYFYKAGVTYEAAFADLDQCRLYALSSRLVALPPTFVPLGTDMVTSGKTVMSPSFPMQYGVVGTIFAGIIVAAAEDDHALATTRRCMAYKGYKRYATSRSVAKQIEDGTETDKLARLAIIASGPQPNVGEVEP